MHNNDENSAAVRTLHPRKRLRAQGLLWSPPRDVTRYIYVNIAIQLSNRISTSSDGILYSPYILINIIYIYNIYIYIYNIYIYIYIYIYA